MIKILTIFGTRPEAVKMAPVIKELERHPDKLVSVVCVTAQHRQMLDQVLSLFEITPDYDLDIMQEDQALPDLTVEVMSCLTEILVKERPDLLLVQGDTTSAMVASMAGFYQKISVGHVEAGLRTYNRYSPYPEEMNRRLIGVLATYHFAPTRRAFDALVAEGVPLENIVLTGNTVIDALHMAIEKPAPRNWLFPSNSHKLILVTAHRRENFGRPFEDICYALKELVDRNKDIEIVYPVHLNPHVREPVYRILSGVENVHLIEPLEYLDFIHVMANAYLVLTDSGGIQEEAPVLGKPVLVMRMETERPEAVEAGTVRVVGTDMDRIMAGTELLLRDTKEYEKMSKAISPYGDGHAAEMIVRFILKKLSPRE